MSEPGGLSQLTTTEPEVLRELFVRFGSIATCVASKALATPMSIWTVPDCVQVTIQLRLRNAFASAGRDVLLTIATPVVAVQPAGRVGVKVVSTRTGPTGPLLRTVACAVT